MKEQLITFETAKLAKEKGFNEYCPYSGYYDPGYYDKYAKRILSKSNKVQLDFSQQRSHSTEHRMKRLILAPTQSLLQKWLREKKNQHIVVEPEKMTDRFYGQTWNSDTRIRIDIQLKETYEELLEKALFEALKLIK